MKMMQHKLPLASVCLRGFNPVALQQGVRGVVEVTIPVDTLRLIATITL